MADIKTMPAALSIVEAAEYANVSRNTIYRLLDAGKLPSARVMGRRLILREDIDSFLRACRETAA